MPELLKTLARLARATSCAAVLAAALGLAAVPGEGAAQNLYGPAITVNEQVITGYELQQRTRMNTILNAPGNPGEAAREQLIDDRLRLQAAAQAGITPTEEEITEGMEEFAGRADLSLDEFVQVLAQGGVARETFRDFVLAGVAWRQVVRARFGRQSAISEEEVDRALGSAGGGGGSNVRVLISELIMPAPPPQADAVRARAERLSQIRSEAEFSAAARQYSATASRGNGGRLPWRDLNELPPPLRSVLLGLAPGEVSDPISIPNAVALFQLRAIEETGYTRPEIGSVEYAAYYLPGGRTRETLAQARVIAQKTDRCDDLYGIAKGQPPERLERKTLPPSQLPTDVAYELSKLDPGEVSTALTRSNGQALMVLMLCGRTNALPEGQERDREELTLSLRNQRLGRLADSYLAQLRADARIVER